MRDRETNIKEAIDKLEREVAELKDHGFSIDRIREIRCLVEYLDGCDFNLRYEEWRFKKVRTCTGGFKGW